MWNEKVYTRINKYFSLVPDEPSRTGDIAIYVLTFVEKNGIDNSSTHPLPSPLVLCVCWIKKYKILCMENK